MVHDSFLVHVVDPDQAIADGLATLLSTYGIEVISYPDAESFLDATSPPSAGHCCLLIEADLPGLSGPALLQQLRDQCVDLPMLLLISTSSPQLMKAARSSRQVGVIEKPFVNGTLIDKVLSIKQHA